MPNGKEDVKRGKRMPNGNNANKNPRKKEKKPKFPNPPKEGKKDFPPNGEEGGNTDEKILKNPVNNWDWYIPDGNRDTLYDVASFSYANVQGLPIQLKHIGTPFQINLDETWTPSSVFCLRMYPAAGVSKVASDAINIASRATYVYTRGANSGGANYESPDLNVYILAVGAAASYLQWLKRVYGTFTLYSGTNRAIPYAILKALHVDYKFEKQNDLSQSLASFRSSINLLIDKLNTLFIPVESKLTQRHMFLCERYFIDALNPKAAILVPTFDGWFKYNATINDQGGGLEFTKLSEFNDGKTLKFSDLIKFGNDLIEPIFTDQDFAIMAGDLRKAFTNGITMDKLQEVYEVEFTYSPEVLSQIHNMNVIDCATIENMDVVQNVGSTASGPFLQWDPTLTFNSMTTGYNPVTGANSIDFTMLNQRLFDMPYAKVLPEDTIVATRLSPTLISESNDNFVSGEKIHFGSVGSEFVHKLTEITMRLVDSELIETVIPTHVYLYNSSPVEGDLPKFNYILHMARLLQFDWHPMLKLIKSNASSGLDCTYLNDVATFTVMSDASIDKMNLYANLAMYFITAYQFAKFSNKN